MFKTGPEPSFSSPDVDPIPPSLRAILDLFAAELRGVGFPGVDAALLGQHADEVRLRARDVEQAQTALDAALSALQDRTAALAAIAARALAYARIYAADDAALAARLIELEAGEPPPALAAGSGPVPLRRRRRRPSAPSSRSATSPEASRWRRPTTDPTEQHLRPWANDTRAADAWQ